MADTKSSSTPASSPAQPTKLDDAKLDKVAGGAIAQSDPDDGGEVTRSGVRRK